MRFDSVMQAVSKRAADDSVIQSIFGATVRLSGRQAFTVPSLEYLLVTVAKPGELWAPCTIQFDSWTDTLDDTMAAAKALVVQRQAELENVTKMTKRTMELVRRRFYSTALGDKAIRNLKVAKAALAAAKSQLTAAQRRLGKVGAANARIKAAKAVATRAKINLKYTKIVSPARGYVAKFTLRKGTSLTAYREVFLVIDDRQWWAAANFKETNLRRIKAGQPATIKVDIYPKHTFKGIVMSISPGSGASFALLPPETASGNWVKVTQRFPVRVKIIKPDPKYPLRLGASCTVTINTQTK